MIELTSYSQVAREVEVLIANEGITYRQVLKPVKIERITEPRVIPAAPIALFYSDGDAPNREVPAGTILSNGRYVLSEEQFQEGYEPYKDENGNIIPEMYIELRLVTAIKNPFGKPIVKLNDNGYPIGKGDENCYIVQDGLMYDRFGFDLLSEESFLEHYVGYIPSQVGKHI